MTAESDPKITENPDRMHVEPPADSQVNVVSPQDYFQAESDSVHCLLLLNQEIRLDPELFAKIWDSSSLKVCADGGANRLYAFSHNDKYVPDFIVGDLDSLEDEPRKFYAQKGVTIKLQASQYYSDLDKSIALIDLRVNFPQIDLSTLDDYSGLETTEADKVSQIQYPKKVLVLVAGAIGGRFDQTIASISRILSSKEKRAFMDFFMLNSEHPEYIIMLPKGRNFIDYPREDEAKLRNVGVLPLSGPATITTKGLKWDIRDWDTCITGDLSLCNLQVGDTGIYLETSSPIFINIEF